MRSLRGIWKSPVRVPAAGFLVLAAVLIRGAIAAVGDITEYPFPNSGSPYGADIGPFDIAAGPDGNLWVTENHANKVARVTTADPPVFSEYPIPSAQSGPRGIAAGRDGNLWFTEQNENKVAKVTTSGVITEYPTPTAYSHPVDIAAGPDGNLWFVENSANNVVKVTTADPPVFTEYPVPTPYSSPQYIAAGPDGNLWFVEGGANAVAKVTTSGVFKEYQIPTRSSSPISIAAGPDGNLWFTERGGSAVGGGSPSKLAKVTTADPPVFTEYAIPDGGADILPFIIAAGPDRNMWLTEARANKVVRATTADPPVLTEYPIPTAASHPFGIVAGPDGNVWFTEAQANKVAKVSVARAPGSPTNVVAAAGDGMASVSWSAPASDGGSPINGYVVTSTPEAHTAAVNGTTTTATVPGLSNGTSYTFTVQATNGAGTGVPSSASNAVTPQAGSSTPSTASGNPPPGGTVTTDPANTGPSAAAPETTAVTTPTGGTVTIAETTTTNVAPTGFRFGNQQVNITAPPATAAQPLRIVFGIYPQPGQTPDTTSIYRTEGGGPPTLVPPCDPGSTGQAVPDPCVASSAYDASNAYIKVTILSSTASQWNVATPRPGAVTVSDSAFSPPILTLPLGASVTWTFTGAKQHSATDALGLGPSRSPLFDSGARRTGTYSYRFVAAGSYPYTSEVEGGRDGREMAGMLSLPVEALPATGQRASAFSIIWSTKALAGYVFDVQVRFKPAGSKNWKQWATFKNGTNTPSGRFTPNQGAGNYDFTARLRNSTTGRTSGWSLGTTITAS